MRTFRTILQVITLIGLWLSFCTFAHGHLMWLNVSDYSPEISSPEDGARTNVYFGWGHRYPVDDFLTDEFLGEFFLISPDGHKEKLKANPGGFRATEVIMKEKGGWIVEAALKPGFFTMYVEKGKVQHKTAPKTGLRGVILSMYYEQYAKALINTGKVSEDTFSKPVGHKLEIIPLENPGKLKGCGGHFLPVRVLFNGKPAMYCQLCATYSGFSATGDFAYATYTDGEGKARIRLLDRGQWLVKAEMKLPPSEELKEKCNELFYTATLTFEIK